MSKEDKIMRGALLPPPPSKKGCRVYIKAQIEIIEFSSVDILEVSGSNSFDDEQDDPFVS